MSSAETHQIAAGSPGGLLQAVVSRAASLNWMETVAAMTLILVLLAAPQSWPFQPAIKVCAIFGVIVRPALTHRAFWTGVTGILAIGYAGIWSTIDNHQYLILYWCTTITLSLWVRRTEPVIRTSARLLVGLCFLFATLWKLFTLEYADGSFFSFLLIGGDDRFIGFAAMSGASTAGITDANKLVIAGLKDPGAAAKTAELLVASGTNLVAQFMTWWTIFIEGLVAVCFLWRRDSLISRYRDVVLIVFALSTYAVATVSGFGWLLIAMGLAQHNRAIAWLPAVYIFTFVVIALYSFPVTLLARSIQNAWGLFF